MGLVHHWTGSVDQTGYKKSVDPTVHSIEPFGTDMWYRFVNTAHISNQFADDARTNPTTVVGIIS